jgi:hypothetical protein
MSKRKKNVQKQETGLKIRLFISHGKFVYSTGRKAAAPPLPTDRHQLTCKQDGGDGYLKIFVVC